MSWTTSTLGRVAAFLVTTMATAMAGAGPSLPMNEAEQAFADKLTGAVLTGQFTVDGEKMSPKPERYEIVNATKTTEKSWIIVARIKYGQNDVRVPIPIDVYWAGDTPVMSLTDLTIPGLGTFTSRVMFYGDRYAGTWQHGEKGGHLFGTITKTSVPTDSPTEPAPDSPEQGKSTTPD